MVYGLREVILPGEHGAKLSVKLAEQARVAGVFVGAYLLSERGTRGLVIALPALDARHEQGSRRSLSAEPVLRVVVARPLGVARGLVQAVLPFARACEVDEGDG